MVGVLAQKWIKAEKAKKAEKAEKAKKQKDKCCQETLKTEKAPDDTIQILSDKLVSN